MNKKRIYLICIASSMAALSIILELLSVRNEASKFTLYSLPLLFSGILFGPWAGLLTGIVSGFISQLCLYGLGPTTLIWMLAPMMWGFLSGLIFHNVMKKNGSLFNISILVIGVSLSITLINTLALYLDGLLLHYPTPYVITQLGVRVATAIGLCIPYIAIIYLSLPRLKPLIMTQKKKDESSF